MATLYDGRAFSGSDDLGIFILSGNGNGKHMCLDSSNQIKSNQIIYAEANHFV